MIKIIRTRDPKAVQYMIPHFSMDTDEEREIAGSQLANMMHAHPESVNVLQAWKGEDIVSFIVGNVADNPYVWIAQGWSKEGNPSMVATEMFTRIMLWAMALGKLSIRAETSRNLEVMYRRFGFEPVATIVERHITPEEISTVLDLGRMVVDG